MGTDLNTETAEIASLCRISHLTGGITGDGSGGTHIHALGAALAPQRIEHDLNLMGLGFWIGTPDAPQRAAF